MAADRAAIQVGLRVGEYTCKNALAPDALRTLTFNELRLITSLGKLSPTDAFTNTKLVRALHEHTQTPTSGLFFCAGL